MCARSVCGATYLGWEVWAACPLVKPRPHPLPRQVGARVLSRFIGTGILLYDRGALVELCWDHGIVFVCPPSRLLKLLGRKKG
jgi:hypothetical protein